MLSPIFGELHGLPPTLFITSGRDLLLSGTVNLHRAYLSAGVDARLVVFDALPHAFWYDSTLPEAIEANHRRYDIVAHRDLADAAARMDQYFGVIKARQPKQAPPQEEPGRTGTLLGTPFREDQRIGSKVASKSLN